ncbi:TonB-dependent receptor [Marinibactrum halimedae]|uniref:TonB-dependent receptor n=1 Tax=Marinibactrum halimedae TaxID=1444977 RepID=A0AA37T9L2_9GAMM|nr:TonB-dependent receptor [Marinibactrum halimedae]MCD9460708.1 TonB-dependent receptor [Marinibactrum halimedae]GLS25167.1 TonB-dependent receptor [Marinibactrum halimedae]
MTNNYKNLRFLQEKRFPKTLLSIAMLSAASFASAQQAEPASSDSAELLEEVVVSGIRASMDRNLDIKRMSGAIVDAITAEDIGKFPDKNVADSLQRVPGIVINRDGGEGAQVSIRGLSSDLTFTQLNGNFIASSPGEPSRSFDYTLLPANFIQRVEVFKSPEARLDEGGVGGTVILHTRKPLDMDANSGILNVEATYADVTEEFEPNFSGMYSWKNDDETLGFLVGYTRQERTNRTLSGTAEPGGGWRWIGDSPAVDVNGNEFTDSTRRFGPITDASGTTHEGAWIPQVVGTTVLEESREREGIQLSGQWQPTERMELGVNVYHFSLSQDRTESQFMIPEWRYNPDYLTDVHYDSSGTVVTGVDFANTPDNQNLEFPWILGGYIEEESTSDTYDFNFAYEGDGYHVKAIVGHTESEGGPSESWRAAYKATNPAAGPNSDIVESAAQVAGWNLNGRVNMYTDPNILTNLLNGFGGNADIGSTNSSFAVSDLEEDYMQLDVEFDVEFGIFTTIHTGMKYRSSALHRETRNTFFVEQETIDGLNNGTIDPDDLGDLGYQRIGGNPETRDILNTSPEDNITGGFGINVMPTINWGRYRSIVSSNYEKYTRREPNFIFEVEEDITSAYLQGDFAHNDIRGNVGVRVVQTDVSTLSTDLFTYLIDDIVDGAPRDSNGNLPRTSGEDRLIDVFTPINQDTDYTHVLPSFNIAWDATDYLVVRGALAKTMSRPGLSDLASPQRLTFVSQEWSDDRASENVVQEQGWSGRGGNDGLEPLEAVQADLSVEYYYAEGSAVGAALFSKEIDNFVVPLQISLTNNFDGFRDIVPAGNITIEPFETFANGTDATSRGIELFAQHAFDNGFGLYANYTYNDTNQADVSLNGEKVGESALVGSSEDQYNLSAYYENDDFSVRVSYNRRGEQILGLSDGINTFADEYEQIDVNASVNLTPDLTLTASIINLTEEEEFVRLGNDTSARLLRSSYSGRRAFLGLNYQF